MSLGMVRDFTAAVGWSSLHCEISIQSMSARGPELPMAPLLELIRELGILLEHPPDEDALHRAPAALFFVGQSAQLSGELRQA